MEFPRKPDEEVEISLLEVQEKNREIIERELANAKIEDIQLDEENGKIVYKAAAG